MDSIRISVSKCYTAIFWIHVNCEPNYILHACAHNKNLIGDFILQIQ